MKNPKLQVIPHYRSQVKQIKLFDERVSEKEYSHIQTKPSSLTRLPRAPAKTVLD